MTEADRLLYATLAGAAARHAGTGALTPEQEAAAVAELRELAGHRPDLLAHRAGTAIGFGESQYDAVVYRLIADLCIKAGADPAQIPGWIEVGRQRAELARQVPYTGAAHPVSHPPPHPAQQPASRPAPHPAAQPGAPRIRPGQVPG
jgi:hypothetical protein